MPFKQKSGRQKISFGVLVIFCFSFFLGGNFEFLFPNQNFSFSVWLRWSRNEAKRFPISNLLKAVCPFDWLANWQIANLERFLTAVCQKEDREQACFNPNQIGHLDSTSIVSQLQALKYNSLNFLKVFHPSGAILFGTQHSPFLQLLLLPQPSSCLDLPLAR